MNIEQITKLTTEQEALIPITRDEWIKIGLDTTPTDKQKVEEAIPMGSYASRDRLRMRKFKATLIIFIEKSHNPQIPKSRPNPHNPQLIFNISATSAAKTCLTCQKSSYY